MYMCYPCYCRSRLGYWQFHKHTTIIKSIIKGSPCQLWTLAVNRRQIKDFFRWRGTLDLGSNNQHYFKYSWLQYNMSVFFCRRYVQVFFLRLWQRTVSVFWLGEEQGYTFSKYFSFYSLLTTATKPSWATHTGRLCWETPQSSWYVLKWCYSHISDIKPYQHLGSSW